VTSDWKSSYFKNQATVGGGVMGEEGDWRTIVPKRDTGVAPPGDVWGKASESVGIM